ncbi:MAG TPA: ABC transporter permease [Polyangiales bacterium]|nr:ABC transporter permease [Polyangiales bacterium]
MLGYLLRRVLWMIPTLIGITLVCFLLLRMANADPVGARYQVGLRGQQISQEALEHLRKLYDLDAPWYVQYGKLLERFVTFDLGTRWQDGRPIAEVIGEALPITLLLSLLSITLAYLIAVPLGVYSAVRQYSLSDRAITLFLFVLYSLPSFWLGTLLIVFLASGKFISCPWLEYGACFPLQGWHAFEGYERMTAWQKLRDVAWHLILPVFTLTYPAFAVISRYMRAGMLETLRQDYVRTARAKGLGERAVVLGHALRNGLIPIVTLIGLELPELISGAVIVESIFGVRGMGYLALEAIRLPDYPLVITIVAFIAGMTMLGTLLSDVLYVVVDPRIQLGKGERG